MRQRLKKKWWGDGKKKKKKPEMDCGLAIQTHIVFTSYCPIQTHRTVWTSND